MEVERGHRHATQAGAILVACVLGFGGSLGQIGFLLHESVHVCTCAISADGGHDCDCPHCSGVNVAPVEVAEPEFAVTSLPCGEETGAAPDVLFTRALLPAPPLSPPLPVPVDTLAHREPPGSHSRCPRGPEPPPPRAA